MIKTHYCFCSRNILVTCYTNNQVTALPDRHFTKILEEYKANLKSSGNVYGKPADISHFCSVFNKITVKKNIRMLKILLAFMADNQNWTGHFVKANNGNLTELWD